VIIGALKYSIYSVVAIDCNQNFILLRFMETNNQNYLYIFKQPNHLKTSGVFSHNLIITMKRFFATYNFAVPVDLALLVLRLVVGYAFIMHGWGKIQYPMGWMGPQSFIPPVFQALAAIAEFGGGIALVIGFLTPLAGLGLLVTMGVAVYTHAFMFKDPFINYKGGSSYEPATIFFCIALLLMAAGAGRYSLDKLVFGDKANLK
jgi:putative oxidoreductase